MEAIEPGEDVIGRFSWRVWEGSNQLQTLNLRTATLKLNKLIII